MNRSTIFNTLILLPVIWLFSGLLVVGDGDKPMVALVVISAITSISYYGLQTTRDNLRHNRVLWVVLALTAYGLFSHFYHGISSREIRALLMASVMLICFPRELISQRLLSWLCLMGSIACFGMAFYYGLYLDMHRGLWPINAIPQATMSAAISLSALAMMTGNDTCNKKILIAAFFIGMAAVIISQTRGVWLGYFITVMLIVALRLRHLLMTRKACLITLATLAVGSFALKPVVEARIDETQYEVNQIMSGNFNTSAGLRLQMWAIAPQLVEDNWLLGLGRYHHEKFNELYRQGQASESLKQENPAHYHNQFLDRLVKSGIIGVILLVTLLSVPLIGLSHVSHQHRYMLSSIVLLYATASLTDVPFSHPQPLLLYIFLVSCLTTSSRKH
ncbi:O-antigen ligase family protein [Photobacterium sp. GSS17]|uniref:O-antigen ligase family protein n=1 Tax=Photobacterium sp. GSS17 TaxID=3020715 RepID=UPI0023619A66|nr:O-antigen ligase family protein [Photobacterium sp. GSS17]